MQFGELDLPFSLVGGSANYVEHDDIAFRLIVVRVIR